MLAAIVLGTGLVGRQELLPLPAALAPLPPPRPFLSRR